MSAASGVLANDTYGCRETLVVSAVGGSGANVGQNVTGSLGTLNLDADGSYTYIADQAGADAITAGQTATDTFTYTLSDGEGTTSTVDLVITVTGKGPQGVADTATATAPSVEKNNAATNGVLQMMMIMHHLIKKACSNCYHRSISWNSWWYNSWYSWYSHDEPRWYLFLCSY